MANDVGIAEVARVDEAGVFVVWDRPTDDRRRVVRVGKVDSVAGIAADCQYPRSTTMG